MKALPEVIVVIISPICVFSAFILDVFLGPISFQEIFKRTFWRNSKMQKDSMLSLSEFFYSTAGALLQGLYFMLSTTRCLYSLPQDERYVNFVVAFAAPRNVRRRPYKVHMQVHSLVLFPPGGSGTGYFLIFDI